MPSGKYVAIDDTTGDFEEISLPASSGGSDGGNLSVNTTLTTSSATRYTLTASPVITLYAVTSANDGDELTFVNIGTGQPSFNVTGGGQISGQTTFPAAGTNIPQYMSWTFKVINGNWYSI